MYYGFCLNGWPSSFSRLNFISLVSARFPKLFESLVIWPIPGMWQLILLPHWLSCKLTFLPEDTMSSILPLCARYPAWGHQDGTGACLARVVGASLSVGAWSGPSGLCSFLSRPCTLEAERGEMDSTFIDGVFSQCQAPCPAATLGSS